MSCCANCAENKPCSGLGEPWAISDYVVAGSVIAWGGYVRDAAGASRWSEVVEQRVKDALWNSGGFSWVDAGQISGFLNQYISIKVTTKVDFAHLGDVMSVIEGAIYQAGFRPEAQNFWVESVPASAANRTDIATPGTGGGMNTPGGQNANSGWPTISLPSLPDIFGGSGTGTVTNPIDRLASWLGVTPTQAAVVGAMAAIGGILLIKRVL